MCRTIRSTLVISVLLISLVPGESKSNQIPPSQSPSPSNGLDSGGGENSGGERGENGEPDQVPPNSPKAELFPNITDERCNSSYTMSCRASNDMTLCLSKGKTGPEGSYLVVQNDKDTTVNVNLTILPSNIVKEIELQKQQAQKINLSEIIGGSRSIILNAGNGSCTIHIPFQWGGANVNPTHGAYILVLMFLIGGGAWTCFELRKRGRHLDGVPYQELEMGQPEIVLAANVETKGGWNEDWDDDWDEEKAVKSPGGKRLRRGKANGNSVASGSSHDDGWGNDWDD